MFCTIRSLVRGSLCFVYPASALFEIHKIKCGESALHIFNLGEFFKAAYQIAHTYTAFLHKIVLLIKAAVIFIAIQRIIIGKYGRVDIARGASNAFAVIPVIPRGQILVFFIVSAPHTEIKVFAECVIERTVQAEFHHIAVAPVGY